MTSRHGRFALFGCLLVVLAGSAKAADHTVVISYDINKFECTQSFDAATGLRIAGPLPPGDTITYTAQTTNNGVPTPGATFVIQFPGTSPFHRFGGTSFQTGKAFGASGSTEHYDTVIVNGQTCGNGRQLGIIMR
jgi:hypothetical protein